MSLALLRLFDWAWLSRSADVKLKGPLSKLLLEADVSNRSRPPQLPEQGWFWVCE